MFKEKHRKKPNAGTQPKNELQQWALKNKSISFSKMSFWVIYLQYLQMINLKEICWYHLIAFLFYWIVTWDNIHRKYKDNNIQRNSDNDSLKLLKIQTPLLIPAIYPFNHRKWLPCQILGRKNVQIDPQKKQIYGRQARCDVVSEWDSDIYRITEELKF